MMRIAGAAAPPGAGGQGRSFIAIDVETANRNAGSICQVGGCIFENGVEVDSFCWIVDPEDIFEPRNVAIHGISAEKVRNAPTFAAIAVDLLSWLEGATVVSHGSFDRTALRQAFGSTDEMMPDCLWVDSCNVARRAWPDSVGGHSLRALAADLGIAFQHHDALEDARTAGLIALAALDILRVNIDNLASPSPRRPGAKTPRNAVEPNVTITLNRDASSTFSRAEIVEMLSQMHLTTFVLSQAVANILTGERQDAIAHYDDVMERLKETTDVLSRLGRKITGQNAS